MLPVRVILVDLVGICCDAFTRSWHYHSFCCCDVSYLHHPLTHVGTSKRAWFARRAGRDGSVAGENWRDVIVVTVIVTVLLVLLLLLLLLLLHTRILAVPTTHTHH